MHNIHVGQILPSRVNIQRVPVVEAFFRTSTRRCTLNLRSSSESGNPKISAKNVVVAMSGDTSDQLRVSKF